MIGLKNLSNLRRYFDYIFVHIKKKVRLRPELSPKFFFNFKPEPDPKSPARLTTLGKNPALSMPIIINVCHLTNFHLENSVKQNCISLARPILTNNNLSVKIKIFADHQIY